MTRGGVLPVTILERNKTHEVICLKQVSQLYLTKAVLRLLAEH